MVVEAGVGRLQELKEMKMYFEFGVLLGLGKGSIAVALVVNKALTPILTRIGLVMRGGKGVEVSIFDLVVGDIVPLKIGDQIQLLADVNLKKTPQLVELVGDNKRSF